MKSILPLVILLAVVLGFINGLLTDDDAESGGVANVQGEQELQSEEPGEIPLTSYDRTERIAVNEAVPGQAHETQPGDEAEEEVIDWEVIEDEGDGEEWLTRVGLAADTPIALRYGRPGPPDPVQQGTSSLRLKLRNRMDGKSFTSEVILWRINAPENRLWTAGDQDIARVQVGEDGFRFGNLADGRYRPVILGERQTATHQEEFEVWGDTELELEVDAPIRRPAILRLESTRSATVSVEASFDPIDQHDRSRQLPPWVRHRDLKPEFNDVFFSSSEGIPTFFPERTWDWLYPDDGAYDLRTFPENTRGTIFRRRVYLRFNGGTKRELWIENPAEGPERLSALSFAMAP